MLQIGGVNVALRQRNLVLYNSHAYTSTGRENIFWKRFLMEQVKNG